MAMLVCFHAHPDDESIATGGLMTIAKRDGHQVVLVVATRGEQGEPEPGVLNDGEPLWERRVVETHQAAEIMGLDRVEFLGYEDSGMIGEPTNENPLCFWQADVEEASQRLAAILREVDADVLTIYDSHGGYGHPDHIQVHRVGKRAAEIAGVDRVFQSTMNRDRIMKQMAENASIFENEVEGELEGETVEQMRRRAEAADRGEFAVRSDLIPSSSKCQMRFSLQHSARNGSSPLKAAAPKANPSAHHFSSELLVIEVELHNGA
jgi:LmbE family N-acetylglucosaminyl deacetylase